MLSMSPSDPTGGGGVQSDLLTGASMGCHVLGVITGLTVQDSAGVEDTKPVNPDWIDDQARCLLEDMNVRALKVGGLFTTEAVSTVAEIAADYSALPLVIHLGADPPETPDAETEDHAEDVIAATIELLVPQAALVVVDRQRLGQWLRDGVLVSESEEVEGNADDAVQMLLSLGAARVLVTGLHEPGEKVVNHLFGTDEATVAYPWPRLPGNFRGAGSTLAAACAGLLAQGLPIGEAVAEAQDYTWQALSAGFRPGMGRMMPDRFFWARGQDAQAPGLAGKTAPGDPA